MALLFLAAALRIAACLAWSADLGRDPDAYRGLAERLLDGRGFAAPDGRPTAYRPPLYPILLATVLPAGRWGIATLQIALGTATVAIVVALGRRLGLNRFALLAGAIVALDPLLLRYTPQIMTEVTCTFLSALVLWLTIIVHDRMPRPSANRRATLLLATTLGASFGLAVLSRPTFWAFGMLAGVAWGYEVARDRTRLRNWIGATGCVLLGLGTVVAPWAVRNNIVIGLPVVTTTHGGYTLLLANNLVFWREVVLAPSDTVWGRERLDEWQHSLEEAMAADGIAATDELARDRWMRDQAFDTIRRHPRLFVRSSVHRVTRFWDIVPAGSIPAATRWSVGTFYAVTQALALLALIGIGIRFWRSFKNREPGPEGRRAENGERLAAWVPALLLVIAFTAVHAIYWSDARMRAPCVPVVALLAARACAMVSARRYAKVAP
ncbi:MAG: glycosyltransferase family 39 protein [Planctomycetota bacterium]|nr:glycosyltransferase family 39 protein [Planctomycetaceae bacterium]MDQ3331830.1 glycosyltransferase family 39 protein [Planctomycetota bacterium]